MATSTKRKPTEQAQADDRLQSKFQVESWRRPTWQIELLQQQTKLQAEVGDMQTYANSTEFHRASEHIKEGVAKQLEATRNLLHVVNERISYFI